MMNAIQLSLAAGVITLHAVARVSTPVPSAAAAASSTEVAGTITRAQFTSGVTDRAPTDSLTTAGTDKTTLYFFTELKGFSGSKVTHRWEHAGKVEREQTFDVGGDRWRVWSNKTLGAHAAGEWKVIVVDGSGAKLGTYSLTYGK